MIGKIGLENILKVLYDPVCIFGNEGSILISDTTIKEEKIRHGSKKKSDRIGLYNFRISL